MSFSLDLGGLVVHLGGEMSSFNEMIANAQAQVKNVTDRLEKMGEKVGAPLQAMGESIAKIGGVITAPIVAAAHVYASFGSEIFEMGERLNVSAQALTEFNYAATQSGTSLGEIEHAMRFMQRGIAGATEGTDRNERMFSQLKISIGELKALNPEDQFLAIADAIGKIEDPSKRTAMAMQIFGRGSTKLMTMMRQGSGEFNVLRKEARELGLTFDGDTALAAQKFDDSLKAMWESLKMISFAVGQQVAPYLQGLAKDMIHLTGWIISFVRENGKAILTALKMGGALTVVGTAIYALGTAITWATTTLSALKKVMAIWSAASAGTLAFYGAILLLVVGIVILTDSLMQLFGITNFGIADMVTSFRVGGFRISTWMAATWANIIATFLPVYNAILNAWDILSVSIQDIGGVIYRTMVEVGFGMRDVFRAAVRGIWDSFSWLAEKMLSSSYALHIIDEHELEKGMGMLKAGTAALDADAAKSAAYQRGLMEDSLGAQEDRWSEYEKNVKARQDEVNAYDQAARDIFMEDAEAVADAKKKAEAPAAEAAKAAETSGKDPFEKGSFKQMSLNRFSIATPDFVQPKDGKKVEDVGVQKRLDTLIDVVRGRPTTATLG